MIGLAQCRSKGIGFLSMALTCDGADMSTNSTKWMELGYNRGGNGMMVGTIHREFSALEILWKSLPKKSCGTINAQQ